MTGLCVYARTCLCAYMWGRGKPENKCCVRTWTHPWFVCTGTSDTVILELNFTPCAFATVRQRGTIDGLQGEDSVGKLCQMKKVVTADRRREKVFIHPKKTSVRGGRGEDEGGEMYTARRSRRAGRDTLCYKKAIWDWALSGVRL